jgi:NAD(P)-dependent dehydrogenase (short-subunit alcohol dehydrogenase family)
VNAECKGFDTQLLKGKVAIVTGGGGGIGRATARMLMQSGARVVSVDLPGRPAAEGAESLDCDLSDSAQVAAMFRAFEADFDRLDVLVHAAGTTRDGVAWKMSDENWHTVLEVNLDSAFFLLRQAVPRMRAGGGGAIVLISSINGERGKFGLGRSLARETGRFGIRVNMVSPGLIDTEMTAGLPANDRQKAIDEGALGTVGRPEDVAAAVLFLTSSLSGHVTGQVLRVDGGQLIA